MLQDQGTSNAAIARLPVQRALIMNAENWSQELQAWPLARTEHPRRMQVLEAVRSMEAEAVAPEEEEAVLVVARQAF